MSSDSDSSAASPQVKRRRRIDLDSKMDIIKWYETGLSLSAIARSIGLPTSTVSTIVKNSSRVKAQAKAWTDLNNSRKASTSEENGNEIFRIGHSKAKVPESGIRESLSISLTKDTEVDRILKLMDPILVENDYLPNQVFVAVRTGLLWKKFPGFELDIRAEDRVSLLLGGNMSGTCKMKPFIVYHMNNPPAFNGISAATLPVNFRSGLKSRITPSLYEDWFINCFVPEVERHCLTSGIPFRVLLVLAGDSGHPPNLDDFHTNVKVMDSSSLDQDFVLTFKMHYLQKVLADAISKDLTFKVFWYRFDILQAVLNVAAAWDDTPAVFTESSTAKRLDVLTSVVKLAHELKMDATVSDFENLVHLPVGELSDYVLEELMKLQKVTKIDSCIVPAFHQRHFSVEGMSKAFRQISAGMSLFESMDPNIARFDKASRLVREAFQCYRKIYNEKKKTDVLQTHSESSKEGEDNDDDLYKNPDSTAAEKLEFCIKVEAHEEPDLLLSPSS